MRHLDDNTIIESSLPVSKQTTTNVQYENFRIYKGRVDDVIFADDKRNTTGQVEYVLTIMSASPNVPYRKVGKAVSLNAMGGINNYFEIIHHPTKARNTKETETEPSFINSTGDIVAVGFLEGNSSFGIIIGPWWHPKNTNAAKKEDGERIKGEYNGVLFEINKDGELEFTMQGGPRDEKGKLTNSENGPTFIKLDKNGKIIVSGNNVLIGDASAEEALVRGDALRTWLSNHVHICPACGVTTSVPTDPVDEPGGADGVLSESHKIE